MKEDLAEKTVVATSTVSGTPLSPDLLRRVHGFWQAACYLGVGMMYLKNNPILARPLEKEDVKKRLLGHWGSSPGQAFIWTHLSRVIKKKDLNMIYLSGPGHGAPGVLGPLFLEESYSETYGNITPDADGMIKFFKQFSFPGGIGSHCTPETPGSIHEGGELGYSLSHGYGTVFDNPDLIAAVCVGDGEAETGPLATAWHSNKFINPVRDGAVLPILHLNGYKINNPTIFARMSDSDLKALFTGYGYKPYFIEGSEFDSMHQAMAAAMDRCIRDIKKIQSDARSGKSTEMPRWPMIVLKSPKGWTGPKVIDGHKVEGFWRAHQVPLSGMHDNEEHFTQLEEWLQSYNPGELFDAEGHLKEEYRSIAPEGSRRMGSNPHANGGLLKRNLVMPDFREYGVKIENPGKIRTENTRPLGVFLRDVMKENMTNFRVFGPDETTSNRINAIYEVSKKFWIADRLPEDDDGGELSADGRVLEMLSEHTLEGWLEGYLLTGRHGFLSTYESFVHVIDSMFNQHAKWLESCNHIPWRADVASLNWLITSTVWRQDHNGFTHQDPGFLDLALNKSPDVVRIYLPPDVNTLLSVANHCLKSENYVNVIVADKQNHVQYLSMEDAVKHCTKGVGIWDWASNDHGVEPDVVVVSAGDIPTTEALAGVTLLREELPDLKIRFINVVDLLTLMPDTEHPHGLSDKEFDTLFTTDKPIIFNFHAYPWMIHKMTYSRTNHKNIHVRGYKEQGSINTPLELAIVNQIDRFSIAMDVIDRVPELRLTGAHSREKFLNEQIDCLNYAREFGVDRPDIDAWEWSL